MTIKENFSLKNYNTFGIAAKAAKFVEVEKEDELKELLCGDECKNKRRFVLGGGSNVLLTGNFDGLVIKMAIPGITLIDETDDDVIIQAGGGVKWHDLVLYCVERNYGGIENLSLIPGTVGAAPIQNIGAYGQELKDVFHSLRGIYTGNCSEGTFSKDECSFGYRTSVFKEELKDKFIITYVSLKLSKNPVINLEYGYLKSEVEKLGRENYSIKDVSEAVSSIRRNKLPDPEKLGNAGSFFKNPVVSSEAFDNLKIIYPDIIGFDVGGAKFKVAAGWLIEKAGLKGMKVGNTGTHEKQALVIVNYGGATGEEVIKFKNLVKENVYKKFGIELSEEVNII
jgi:UDP-N-acetylmuramate dehydrogenase